MQLVCVCIYTTQKDYTVRCKSHLTTKNHTREGEEGGQRGSKVISEGMSVCVHQTAVK